MCKRCFQKAKANGCDICAQVRGLERGSFATFEHGSRGLQVGGFRFEFSRLSESDRWKQDRLKGHYLAHLNPLIMSLNSACRSVLLVLSSLMMEIHTHGSAMLQVISDPK